jgi:hypothetical protein
MNRLDTLIEMDQSICEGMDGTAMTAFDMIVEGLRGICPSSLEEQFEAMVRSELEVDGWLLATLYSPFFVMFAFYVYNDYFRYVQSSSSSL